MYSISTFKVADNQHNWYARERELLGNDVAIILFFFFVTFVAILLLPQLSTQWHCCSCRYHRSHHRRSTKSKIRFENLVIRKLNYPKYVATFSGAHTYVHYLIYSENTVISIPLLLIRSLRAVIWSLDKWRTTTYTHTLAHIPTIQRCPLWNQ